MPATIDAVSARCEGTSRLTKSAIPAPQTEHQLLKSLLLSLTGILRYLEGEIAGDFFLSADRLHKQQGGGWLF